MATLKITSDMDSGPFNKGVDKMQTRTKRFATQLKGIRNSMAGAFSAAVLIGAAKRAIEFGSTLTDLSKQSGLTTDQFQALEIMAIRAGVPIEKLRAAMLKLNVVMGQAKAGMKTYVDLFQRAGVTTEELNTLDPAQIFERLAQTAATASAGSSELGAVLELLGTRSAGQLKEVFEELNKKGLEPSIANFKALGKIIDENTLKSLDETADQIKIVERDITGFIGKGIAGIKDLAAAAGRATIGFEIESTANRAKGGGLTGKAGLAADVSAAAISVAKELDGIQDSQLSAKQKDRDEQSVADDKAVDAQKTITDLVQQRAKAKVGKLSSDRLAKIGGFLGGSASPVVNAPMDKLTNIQLQVLAEMKRNPQETARALRSIGTLGSV